MPDRPETGYGYIQTGGVVPTGGLTGSASDAHGAGAGTAKRSSEVLELRRFVEKPDAETTAAYIAIGEYLWNSILLMLRVSVSVSVSVWSKAIDRFDPADRDPPRWPGHSTSMR